MRYSIATNHTLAVVETAKTLELAGSGLALLGALGTGYGLLRVLDRVTGRVEKLRKALRAIAADARFGFTGQVEMHSGGAGVSVVPEVAASGILAVPPDPDAEVLRNAIMEDRKDVAKVRAEMVKLRKEARADAAEMVKTAVAELESKLNVIERGDLWPAALGIAITIIGGAIGWYGIYLS